MVVMAQKGNKRKDSQMLVDRKSPKFLLPPFVGVLFKLFNLLLRPSKNGARSQLEILTPTAIKGET